MTSSFSKYSRRRRPDRLTSAWLALMALSVGSALLTLLPIPPAILGGLILLLALFKARMILGRYLELDRSPRWLGGFTTVLSGFCALTYLLYLV